MLKKIVLFIYIIIIGIAITIIILSNSVTETGIIAINNNALVTVDNNLLKPKIVAGDLVVVDITTKKVKTNIPFLGNILTYLMTTKGFLTVTLLPAIIILIGYIISFILSLSKRKRII